MNVFELFAKINLDKSEYEAGLSDAESKSSNLGEKLKSGFATVAKTTVAGVSVAVGGISALTKSAVENYADYEQLVGGVETLFKESADIVEGYAFEASKSAGLSANEYMETVTGFSASLLQSLGGDTKKSAEIANMAIIDMSDNANKMGSDMSSIQNAYQGFAKQNYTMLDNLKLGYGGTKEEMQRLLSDAEKLPSAMGKKFDLSNYADIVQAIHLVQENMDITGTTAKEASTTISGSLGMVKSDFQNLVLAISQGNDWDLDAYFSGLQTSIETFIGNVIPVVEKSLLGIGKLIEYELPVIMEEVPKIINSILPSLMESGLNLIKAIGQGIMDNLSLLIDSALGIVMQIGSFLIESLPELIPAVVDIVLTILDALINNADLLIDGAVKLMLGLAQGFEKAFPKIVEKIPLMITKLVDAIGNNLPALIKGAGAMIVALAQGLFVALPQLLRQIPQLIIQIANAFGIKAIDGFEGVGANIIRGIWNGLAGGWDWLMNKVSDLAGNLIKSAKSALGIHSPSKAFAQIGEYCAEGFDEGMEDLMDADSLSKNIKSGLQSVQGSLGNISITGSSIQGLADQNVSVNITLAGDADGIFRVVRQESKKFYQSTGVQAFA